MKHRIDPTIDCVFKSLLGSEKNKNLLIHFLNAVIEPRSQFPIATVDILNPYNEKEFLSDKLSIVDIKAKDEAGYTYQIEIQILTYGTLSARMSYGLCDLYASQLEEGKGYDRLKPVISIWVLPRNILPDSSSFHHHFQLYDAGNRVLLHDHLSLHVLELEKWNKARVDEPIDHWVKFLRDGKNLDDENLPDYMQTKEMRQAMNTLIQFSEKERDYHQYQARMNYIREKITIEEERSQTVQKLDQAIQERDRIAQKLGQTVQERDLTAQKLDQTAQERDLAAQERDLAAQERDLAAQREQVALEELTRLRKTLQEVGIHPKK